MKILISLWKTFKHFFIFFGSIIVIGVIISYITDTFGELGSAGVILGTIFLGLWILEYEYGDN